MRFLSEDTLANEIAEMINSDFEYHDRHGFRKFSYEINFNQGELVFVDGTVEYDVDYDEDVNYAFISFASVSINDISIFDNDDNEVKCEYNVAKIEEYIKDYLTE